MVQGIVRCVAASTFFFVEYKGEKNVKFQGGLSGNSFFSVDETQSKVGGGHLSPSSDFNIPYDEKNHTLSEKK